MHLKQKDKNVNFLIKTFAIIGFIFTSLFSYGLYLDIKAMDKTKGGYESPYENVKGEILDWDNMDLTSTGLVQRGHIVNFIVNATTGMISIELFGFSYEARKLSPRAIKVHKPREAFIKRGFSPNF